MDSRETHHSEKDPSMQHTIEQYLAWMRAADCPLARSTRRTWQPILRQYARWIGQNARLSDFNVQSLSNYARYLGVNGKRPRTIHSTFCALRAFGRWLVEARVLSENPAQSVSLPKLDQAKRDLVSDGELADLLAACDRIADARRAALTRALLAVFLYTGLRRAECLALKLSDVDLSRQSLYVRSGKGGKPRTAYLPAAQLASLRLWLRLRGDCRHEWLWAWDSGRRVGDRALKRLLEEVAAIAGHAGQPNLKPHSFRHSYACRLLRSGVDIETVRASLGHSSLLVTQSYLHTDSQQLRDAAERLALSEQAPPPTVPHPHRRASRRWQIERRQADG